ncbi:hypothetical protein ACE3NQ_09190 [Paenibacillus terreus]|uniref:Uncharacterized protein n=1 Tax=Paenibacillus terreus TaxID=1387834 RepID=A0ABV5B5Z5_9BACL
MDDNFIKELRRTSRNDKQRSELLIKGMKAVLQERKEESRIKRWMRMYRDKKRLTRKFRS